MRYIRRRRIPPEYYDAQSRRNEIVVSHRVKRCATCTLEVPESDITIEDGQERCPMCMDTLTADWLSKEDERTAEVKQQSALRLVQPPQFSIRGLTESRPAAVTSITTSAGVTVSQSAPLSMTRNVAATLLLNGRYFSTSVTFTYPTGITDSTAPVITTTRITLSIKAAIGMTTGAYTLTLNDGVSTYGHKWINILAVR